MSEKEIDPYFHQRKDAGIYIQIPVRDDEGRYHIWLQQDTGWLRLQPVDIAVSDYFAKERASEQDIFSPFVDFLYQNCRSGEVLRLLKCITDDMHNLGACFRKLELYHEEGQRGRGTETRYFVITEIEYIVGVCRSLYDLQQRIAQALWHLIALKDKTVKKSELPDTFSSMALHNNNPKTSEELRARYGIGPKLAAYYPGEADFFLKLRKFRNDIEHGGLTPQLVFTTPKGFGVNADSKSFAQFGIWKEETFLPNRIAPLKPVMAFIVGQSLQSMVRFAQALAGETAFAGGEIAPGYRVFMRGYYIDRLARLSDYIERDSWYPEISKVEKPEPA